MTSNTTVENDHKPSLTYILIIVVYYNIYLYLALHISFLIGLGRIKVYFWIHKKNLKIIN